MYEDVDNISYFERGWAVIASVGWYVLGIVIALLYASPYIRERYKNWKLKRDEQEYAAKYHKDLDFMQQRLSEIEASRQRMQEQYERSSALALEKEKERKEKKRQECAKLLEGMESGKTLGNPEENASTSTGSKSLKSGYNPLIGDNTRRYRPPKRSCCGKGGCG